MSVLAEPWMDDLEEHVSAAATRVAERLRARGRSRRIAALAVAVILIVGSAALAETTPFHPIASFRGLFAAQRQTTPSDALRPVLLQQLRRFPVAGLKLDQTRLMATLPGGGQLYAAPRTDGNLCLILAIGPDSEGATACGPPLGARIPITFLTTGGSNLPTLITGLARDDVRTVSFTAYGLTHVMRVRHNAFWYSATWGPPSPFSFTVEFTDGTTVVYPRRTR
jgi:hypothetical protein